MNTSFRPAFPNVFIDLIWERGKKKKKDSTVKRKLRKCWILQHVSFLQQDFSEPLHSQILC